MAVTKHPATERARGGIQHHKVTAVVITLVLFNQGIFWAAWYLARQ